MKIANVRGTKDLFGQELEKFHFVENIANQVANAYGFCGLKTPIIETTELFVRNLGETSDVVKKEIYSFLDKSGGEICLRPEFTAAVVRSFIANFQHLPLPVKLFSTGPLFRYERPQKGRYRQFHQVNFEIIGAKDHYFDVEAILLAVTFLEKLGIKYNLEINSLGCDQTRAEYKKALVLYLEKYVSELSPESVQRLEKNPLRILDSKDRNDNLIVENAPKISDYYTDFAKEMFENICQSLKKLGINFTANQKLVRGLDYYSHTVFEFKTSQLGAQDTILAGGRYEDLIQNLGGKKTSAIGFAAGTERLIEIMSFADQDDQKIISLIPIGQLAEEKAIELAFILRKSGVNIDLHYSTSLKSRMKKAEKSLYCIIFGDSELERNEVVIKNMQTGTQQITKLDQLNDAISACLK